MGIFGKLVLENAVQTDDKTRLDATKSFVSKEESPITKVEIEPEAAGGFIDVTGGSSEDYYLDTQYSGSSRTVTVSVRVTTDGSPVTTTEDIEVLTPADDKLLSNDADLKTHEPCILGNVQDGRTTYLDVHRRARDLIIDWLYENSFVDDTGNRLTKDSIVLTEPFRKWSTYLTLRLIFEGLSNAVDDDFADKAVKYEGKEHESRKLAILPLDLDGDGSVEVNEGIRVNSLDMLRR